jgi:hypothetical protein
MNKILVSDVYTLKNLFKISTGDEAAVFDSHITQLQDHEVLKIAHIGNDKAYSFIVKTCKLGNTSYLIRILTCLLIYSFN